MEKTLAAIWAKVLRVENVGIESTFFDFGGHSLLMVQVQARLSEALKTNVPIVVLFQYPTIRSLARHFDQLSTSAGAGAGTMRNIRERARLQRQAMVQHQPVGGV